MSGMSRTLLICGHGPGISDAVARKFGAEGFQVALLARDPGRLSTSAATLGDAGITAEAFACDLSDVAALQQTIARVRAQLGPITVIHWNASLTRAGDLTTCELDELREVYELGVVAPVAAVQAALPDLRTQADAAVLVTGGGFGAYSEHVDKMVVQWSMMGLALCKSAQHKLASLLHHKLAGENIYVGEVVVRAVVKGTGFDRGNGTLAAEDVGEEFWRIYRGRSEASVDIG